MIQAAKKAMEDFKATVIIEYVSVAAELYVDGQNDGYIDFGASENYSKFGNTGEQVFTVELWVKLKYTSGFGTVVDGKRVIQIVCEDDDTYDAFA